MKVRRYFAANMRSALEMVRQEQGPDVMILSNRKVANGVELVTADGEIDEKLARAFSRKAEETTARDETPATARPRPVAKPRDEVSEPARMAAKTAPRAIIDDEHIEGNDGASLWSDRTTVLSMQRELKGLKSLLEQQLSGLAWSDFGGKHPLRARLLRSLTRAGIAPSLARALLDDLPDGLTFGDGWQFTLDTLGARLHVLEDPILARGGRVALCGPTGVGKTLLACKLAAQFALRHGPERVALISTDEERLGAQQQIKVFGGLLGIDVHSARGAEDLSVCLNRLEDKDLVLIDTAGAPVDDLALRELLMRLHADDPRAQSFLVVGANTDYQSLTRTLEAGDDLGFDGCVLTKLDEAAVLGPALSALIEAHMPVAYLSAGQRVPDDLEAPLAHQLVSRAIALADDTPVHDDPIVMERAFTN